MAARRLGSLTAALNFVSLIVTDHENDHFALFQLKPTRLQNLFENIPA